MLHRNPALVVLGVTITLTLVILWVAQRFTLEGRLADRFGGIVMAAPMASELRQPPVDVSPHVCPHIDAALGAQVAPRVQVEVGWGFGVRLLIIEVGSLGECSAMVQPGVAF
ncbi:hypothetical protein [Devosia sediminis]|uniref:Uncharacterized protein n=1 Tax=Devosia sediminis TaxID=2798801 RepID=A0A934MKW5_9HYPH|nr:hypothetical protein [Devosia sediminis]MBJ3784021.1 hypothetical protein [Devosia sediminis]